MNTLDQPPTTEPLKPIGNGPEDPMLILIFIEYPPSLSGMFTLPPLLADIFRTAMQPFLITGLGFIGHPAGAIGRFQVRAKDHVAALLALREKLSALNYLEVSHVGYFEPAGLRVYHGVGDKIVAVEECFDAAADAVSEAGRVFNHHQNPDNVRRASASE